MTTPFGRRPISGTSTGDPFSESASFCNGWAGILGFDGAGIQEGGSSDDGSSDNNNNNNNNG